MPIGSFYGNSEMRLSLWKSYTVKQHVLYANDIHVDPYYSEFTIWKKPFLPDGAGNFFFEIEATRPFRTQSFSFQITAPIFLQKNFSGSALRLIHDIHAIFSIVRPFRFNIQSETKIFSSSRIYNSLLSDLSLTPIKYEYKVLLDGIDVTNKVSSCTVTYALDSFVGELDITWTDQSLYSTVDCSNMRKNYLLERVEVLTRVLSDDNPLWVSQGRFFLESRSISLQFGEQVLSSWGRSRAAVLSLPYAKPLTKTWVEDTTALNIAQDICDTADLPVTLQWEIANYKITGSNLEADGSEPIEIISTLAATLGGVLTATRNGALRVIYRYPEDNVAVYTPMVPDPPYITGVIGGNGQAMVYFS